MPVATEERDYEAAGLMIDRLRRKGLTVHAADALIATVTMRAGARLVTTDPDFRAIAAHEALNLVEP